MLYLLAQARGQLLQHVHISIVDVLVIGGEGDSFPSAATPG